MNYPTFNEIYDNGSVVLGNVQKIIIEIENEMQKGTYMFDVDMQELLKDLKELRDIDNNMIVCVNYDRGWKYSIDYWSPKDVIK